MRRVFSGALVAGAGVLAAVSGWKTVGSARALAGADEAVARAWAATSGAAPTAGVRLRPAVPGAAAVELAALEHAVVFVFDVDCGPCGANMWNWVELVRDLPRDSVALVAVGFREPERSARYWAGMDRRVRVVLADTAEMRTRLGVDITPTTLLVQGGKVRRTYRGMLDPAAKAEILAAVRER